MLVLFAWQVASVIVAVLAIRYRNEAIRRRAEAAVWRSRANTRGRLLRSSWGRKCGPPIDPATAGRILACLCSHGETVS